MKQSGIQLKVECYAGYRADERPVRFYLGKNVYEVQEVLDRWYEPEDTLFKVRAQDGNDYILRHRRGEEEESWTLESFRQNASNPSVKI